MECRHSLEIEVAFGFEDFFFFFFFLIATIIQQHTKDLSLEKKFQAKALVSCDIMDLKCHYTPTYFKF